MTNLKSIYVDNFMNLKNINIEFDPYINIITGLNNSGKTALSHVFNNIIYFMNFKYDDLSYTFKIRSNFINMDKKNCFIEFKINNVYDSDNNDFTISLHSDRVPIFSENFKPIINNLNSAIYIMYNNTLFDNDNNIYNLQYFMSHGNSKFNIKVIEILEDILNIKIKIIDNHTLQINERKYYISLLSSSMLYILTLIFNICYKCYVNNNEVEEPIHGHGIVFIDNIDQYIDYDFQSIIINKLHKWFPNIQFFITTKSPIIINNTKKQNLIVLKDGMIDNNIPMETYGKSVDDILIEVLKIKNNKPENVTKLLNDVYIKISEDNLEKVIELYDQLKLLIKDDPELVGIKAVIDRMSYLKNKNNS